ncbi:hypothetical protein Nepgr_007840 [Nepenthes gracilis]|uniref:Uncharacterized protein n=1 Tax=Nepenthes gracilis TaxID=150966 RepID=A0AAD3XIU3_NEPGR|nr:hypothetical protein Nepgr_007840 [Nepenthes gracilis]
MHFARICVEWKLKHHGNGRPANQKSTYESTATHQAVTSAEPIASNAIIKVPVDSIPISPKAEGEFLVNSAPAFGMSGGLEDRSLVSAMKLSPQEGACAASGKNSTCGLGLVSLSPLADGMLYLLRVLSVQQQVQYGHLGRMLLSFPVCLMYLVAKSMLMGPLMSDVAVGHFIALRLLAVLRQWDDFPYALQISRGEIFPCLDDDACSLPLLASGNLVMKRLLSPFQIGALSGNVVCCCWEGVTGSLRLLSSCRCPIEAEDAWRDAGSFPHLFEALPGILLDGRRSFGRSAKYQGAVSLDARSPEIGLPESVKVSPDLALSGKLPAVPDSGRPPAISWSRVVQEVTVEYQRKLVRCGTCRKVGHSFCHPKKVYKPTGRVLPLPSSFSGPALKNPPSPKEMVKEKHNDIATSNSFEILLEKDDQLKLGNLVSQDELLSEEVVKDSLEYHDACNSCLDLPPPDPSGPISSEVVMVTDEDTIAPKAPLISLAVDVGHSNLEELAFCGNVDSCVGISPKNPICCEELAIISNPLGSLCPNSKLLSNGPDGSPPGRNTRARKAKRSSETGSAAGKSIHVPGNARKIQEQTKKINEILLKSKGPKSSIPSSSLSNG